MSQLSLDGLALDWTGQDIDVLHDGLLVEKLGRLMDPHTGKQQLFEEFDWVFEPVVRRKPLVPLSFQACCYVLRVDPEELQCLIRSMLKRAGVLDYLNDREKNSLRVRNKRRVRHQGPQVVLDLLLEESEQQPQGPTSSQDEIRKMLGGFRRRTQDLAQAALF